MPGTSAEERHEAQDFQAGKNEESAAARRQDAASEAALDEGSAEAFRAVEPDGFKDHPCSSIEAALVDPDVDDTKGGE